MLRKSSQTSQQASHDWRSTGKRKHRTLCVPKYKSTAEWDGQKDNLRSLSLYPTGRPEACSPYTTTCFCTAIALWSRLLCERIHWRKSMSVIRESHGAN